MALPTRLQQLPQRRSGNTSPPGPTHCATHHRCLLRAVGVAGRLLSCSEPVEGCRWRLGRTSFLLCTQHPLRPSSLPARGASLPSSLPTPPLCRLPDPACPPAITPLPTHRACTCVQDVLHFLLRGGADAGKVDNNGLTAVYEAARMGSHACLDLLLEHKAE